MALPTARGNRATNLRGVKGKEVSAYSSQGAFHKEIDSRGQEDCWANGAEDLLFDAFELSCSRMRSEGWAGKSLAGRVSRWFRVASVAQCGNSAARVRVEAAQGAERSGRLTQWEINQKL